MKKVSLLITGLILFFSFAPLSSAEYTVMPEPPHERQFQFEILPGESETAGVIINNLGNNELNLELYSADATNSNLGTFALTTRSTEQRHIGKWVSFEEEMITVPPREEEIIPFTINIPENATPGNYGGGIAVEALSSAINPYDIDDGTDDAVSISARIILKMFINVPGDKIHDYEWTNFSYTEITETGNHSFLFSFRNEGNTIILAEPKIELAGIPPLRKNELTLPLLTIQPGTALQNIQKRWDEDPGYGFYTAKATVDFSELDIITNEKVNGDQQSRSITINLTPTAIVVIIVGAIVFLLLILIVLHVQKKHFMMSLEAYTVKEADTLTNIASARNISWKKLAKINKIKAPYSIQTGQNLLVPPLK